MHDREPGQVMGWAVMGAGCGAGRGDADDYLSFPSFPLGGYFLSRHSIGGYFLSRGAVFIRTGYFISTPSMSA